MAMITAATAAATSVYTVRRDELPVKFQVIGVLTTEAISVYEVDSADGEHLAYDSLGSLVQITVTNPSITVFGPGKLKFSKPETANAVGLEKASE